MIEYIFNWFGTTHCSNIIYSLSAYLIYVQYKGSKKIANSNLLLKYRERIFTDPKLKAQFEKFDNELTRDGWYSKDFLHTDEKIELNSYLYLLCSICSIIRINSMNDWYTSFVYCTLKSLYESNALRCYLRDLYHINNEDGNSFFFDPILQFWIDRRIMDKAELIRFKKFESKMNI